MIAKRTIRLKEWGICLDTTKRPLKDQLEKHNDGTLLDREFRLRTDSFGFMLTGNEDVDPKKLRKIVLLGGSFVEALYAPEKDRFPSRLERSLNNSGMHVAVWNGGVSGATLLHSFNVYLNKVLAFGAEIERTLVFTAMSDQRTQVISRSYWLADPTHAPILDDRNRVVREDRSPSTVEQERLLRSLIALARNFHQEVSVVLSPFRAGAYDDDPFVHRYYSDPESYAWYLHRLGLTNETAKKVALEEGVPLIDAQMALGGDPRFFYDTLHLNARGQEKMAEVLADAILSSE